MANALEQRIAELEKENEQLKEEVNTAEQMIDDLQKQSGTATPKLPIVRIKGGGEYQFTAGKIKIHINDNWQELTAEEAAKDKEVVQKLIDMESGILQKL